MSYRIVNIVATADLGQRVDLTEVAKIHYTIHDPHIYGGRVTYLKTPTMYGKTTIFPSGKLISVGTTTKEQIESDLQETINILSEAALIHTVQFSVNIRNIVALLELTESIDLEQLNIPSTIYEPEQFPAAILKIKEPKATFLIFNSGKIVISGVKTEDELKISVKLIKEIISQIKE